MAEEQVKKPCPDCDRDIDIGVRRCPYCKCRQKFRPCVVCGRGIRKGAQYCEFCKSYQDVRKHLGLSPILFSILTTLVAVLPPAIHAYIDYLNRDSNTTMAVKDADENGVYVQFRNSGRQVSQIVRAQLIFDKSIPLLTADLQQAEIGNTLIRPNEPLSVVLRLSAGLRRTNNDDDEKIFQQIRAKKVRLRCVVAESNNPAHILPDVELPDAGAHDLIQKGLTHV
jgi:hypothetical protein